MTAPSPLRSQLPTALVLAAGVVVTGLFVISPRPANEAPFTPGADDVLERVPVTRERFERPRDEAAAAALAKQLVVEARLAGGDPRLLGRAQAVLQPWWSAPAPSDEVLLMRATIKQSLHDFEGALTDLNTLVARTPDDAQAWLTRSTVLFVLARYDEALESCDHLWPTHPEHSSYCRLPSTAVRGASTVLSTSETHPPVDPGLAGWRSSLYGEIARWAGDHKRAEKEFRHALELEANDAYSRLQLAELLLDDHRPKEVAALFDGRELNDTELLLVVLALEAANTQDPEKRADLDARVAANRLRGETLHRREEARYALRLEKDLERAATLASENWLVQKEPADARILLEVAQALGRPSLGAPAAEWMKTTGFEQPELRELLR